MSQVTASSSGISSYLGTDSRFAKVVLAIERDIIEGRLPPDSPLKSLRELASEFQVSQMVIIKAMDVLERKGLIRRLPRKGIFVRQRPVDHSIMNLFLFAMDLTPQRNPFVRSILRLIHYLPQDERYSFTIRLCSSDSPSSVGNLDYELVELEKMDFPDCALIMPMGFLRKDIERVLRLPFPVIFIGDFLEGDYDDLNYLRVSVDQTVIWRCLVDYIRGRGYRKVVHLLLEYQYKGDDKRNFQYLSELSQQHGIEMIPLWVPCVGEQEVSASICRVLHDNRELLASADLLVNLYHTLPDPGFPLPEVCCINLGTTDTIPGCVHLEYSRDEQFEAIHQMLRHLHEYRNQRLIKIVEGHVTIYR